MNESKVTLWLLMRNDMASMNPGKACAQAHHAASQLYAQNMIMSSNVYNMWRRQTGYSFGVVKTLAMPLEQIEHFITQATIDSGDNRAALVIDPTYPVRDGDVTHYIHIATCGYILGRNDEVPQTLFDQPLMP